MRWRSCVGSFLLWAALHSSLLAQDESNLPPAPSSQMGAEHTDIRPEIGQPSYQLPPGEDPENRLGMPFLRHLATDQKTFWTSPTRVQRRDLRLLLPFAGLTAGLIASDSWLAKQVPDRPTQLRTSRDVSNYALFTLAGTAGGSFLLGQMKGNSHLRETGLLSGEAAINAIAVDFAFKSAFQRERPLDGTGHGHFFAGGGSFPSEHTATAWSLASVFAHEYPGPLSKFFAYGLASTVTLTRITSKEHFASDAVVGSALGWFIGRQVYRAHHDPELGGTAWGDFLEGGDRGPRNPANMGSPYVPIDSWVYPAFDRLAALGYIKTAYAGIRPWTRLECARLVEEGEDALGGSEASDESGMVKALSAEFADDIRHLGGAANVGAVVDSVYTRMTGISGTPLNDGYHFGQTIINDYGRPYGEGFNNVSGFSAYALAGPISISMQAEYQRAPSVASYSGEVLDAIASQDDTMPLSNGRPDVSRFRLLDSSIALTFRNTRISFGKQSLWLGPSPGGPFLLSNNSEPVPMLRIDQVSPTHVPGLSRLIGPVRTEFFLGQLSGQNWILNEGTLLGPNIGHQPFIHGDKITFKPTANLEIGMGITVVFGGDGVPVTWKNFFRTYTSAGLASNGLPGTTADPGDRRSSADISYRIPHFRNWITVYADSLVEDEISPIGSSRPAVRPGIYFPKIPRINKLDLRLEAVYTDAPNTIFIGNVYHNSRFRSGYTNNEAIMGSWVGRAGKGGQASATYHFTPRNLLQFAYRRQQVSSQFLRGGRLDDFGVQAELLLRSDISLNAGVQYERWRFPLLAGEPQSNVTTSVSLTFRPRWMKASPRIP